jgi:hypothetical protein
LYGKLVELDLLTEWFICDPKASKKTSGLVKLSRSLIASFAGWQLKAFWATLSPKDYPCWHVVDGSCRSCAAAEAAEFVLVKETLR